MSLAKRKSATRPSQYVGAERKKSVVPVATRSVFERGLSAVRIPTGSAISHPEDERAERDRDARRKAGDDLLAHRDLRVVRVAEVEVGDDVRSVDPELLVERLVEAEVRPHLLDELRGRVSARAQDRRVARREHVEHEEGEERDDDEEERRPREAPDDVAEERRSDRASDDRPEQTGPPGPALDPRCESGGRGLGGRRGRGASLLDRRRRQVEESRVPELLRGHDAIGDDVGTLVHWVMTTGACSVIILSILPHAA